MNNSLRVLFSVFVVVFLIPFQSVGQEKTVPEKIFLPDEFVISQLKIADSLSVNNGNKADSILNFLLENQIQNKSLWEQAVELKRVTMTWQSQHNEAVEFLEEVIKESEPNPNFFFALAREFINLYDYSNAISNAQQAVQLYKNGGDLKGVVKANNLLILIYGEIKLFDEAQNVFIENLKLCNKINYKEGMVRAYVEYGEALVFDNPVLASEYLQKGYEIAGTSTDLDLRCIVSNYLIRFYINTNNLVIAKQEAKNYISNCISNNHQRDSNVFSLMAHIFSLEKNKLDSAIYYNNRALELRIKSGNKNMISNSYLNIAGNYLRKNEALKANYFLEKAEKIIFNLNNKELLITYYQSKVKYYEYINDYTNAYLYSRKELSLTQDLTDSRHKSALSKVNASFEIQQKNILLQKELENRQTRLRYLLFLFFSILLLLGVAYLIKLNQQKTYLNKRLASKAKFIEKRLAISDQEKFKLQSVFDFSVTGILILNKDGLIKYANPRSRMLMHQTPESQFLHLPFVNFFEESNRNLVEEALLRVFIEHKPNTGFKVQIFKNKSFYWLDISFAPLVLQHEEDSILVTLIDVTQEVLSIGMEQKQKNELQTLLNSVPESILFLERTGKITALNNTAAFRLNEIPEKLIDLDYFQVIPNSLRQSRSKMFEKVINSKAPLIEVEIEEGFYNLVSMYPNLTTENHVDYISLFVQDISEKRQAEEQIDNLQQRVLRSQMNPHFIFNSLTSIQSFVIRNDAESASRYLNSFSRLIRLILESSRFDYISLKNEIDILNYYLEIQKMRFSDTFVYNFEIDPDLNLEKIKIPPMLAQPFIENAIEHGIQHLEILGELSVKFSRIENRLFFELRDNGIGREASALLNKENIFASKSLSTKITNDRIDALNKYSKAAISYNIIDLKDEHQKAKGTLVVISIPLEND